MSYLLELWKSRNIFGSVREVMTYISEVHDHWEIFRDVFPGLLGVAGVIGTYCSKAFGSDGVYDLQQCAYPAAECLDSSLSHTLVTSPSMYSAV